MEKLNAIRGAIFDLDGTILDSMWIWDEIDRRFLNKRGIAVPDDYLRAVNGMEFAEAADYTIARFSLPDRPQTLIDEWSQMARDAYADEIALKPYAKDFLKALHARGVKLGIATSSMPDLYVPALKRNGLLDLFSAATVTKEVPRGKSFPDVYLETARRLNLSPTDCAVFEDILVGVRSAKSAGFFAVAVYDPYSAADTPDIKRAADLYIDDFSALL